MPVFNGMIEEARGDEIRIRQKVGRLVRHEAYANISGSLKRRKIALQIFDQCGEFVTPQRGSPRFEYALVERGGEPAIACFLLFIAGSDDPESTILFVALQHVGETLRIECHLAAVAGVQNDKQVHQIRRSEEHTSELQSLRH